MNYAAIAKLAVTYGRTYGPKAMKAWGALAPVVAKNPQVAKLTDQLSQRLSTPRSGSKLSNQIELAKEIATDARTAQSLPDRQALARIWIQKAKDLKIAKQASEASSRKVKKIRLKDVAERIDALLMEIIETTTKWAES